MSAPDNFIDAPEMYRATPMTAPTTRETADHAELARLADEMVGLLAPSQGERLLEYERHQLDVASRIQSLSRAILSEIAALRGERDEQEATKLAAYDRLSVEINDRDQAERQRDELRKALGEAQRRLTATGDFFGARLANEALINQGAE